MFDHIKLLSQNFTKKYFFLKSKTCFFFHKLFFIFLCWCRNTNLLDFVNNSPIQKEMMHYKIKLGYGRHVGWAIEGATLFLIKNVFFFPQAFFYFLMLV